MNKEEKANENLDYEKIDIAKDIFKKSILAYSRTYYKQ